MEPCDVQNNSETVRDPCYPTQEPVNGLPEAVSDQCTIASLTSTSDGDVASQRDLSLATEECGNIVRMQLLVDYGPKPAPETPLSSRLRIALQCPPQGAVASAVVDGAFVFVVLTLTMSMMIDVSRGIPEAFLTFCCIYLTSHVFAWLTMKAHLPEELGMLLAGVLCSHVLYDFGDRLIDFDVFRTSALCLILLRVGLGVNFDDFKRLSFTAVRLAIVPGLTEVVICTITSHLLLDIPWQWGLIVWFSVAAVSQPVVVRSMLSMEERGLGVEQGIPALVLAAANVDDVLAVGAICITLSGANTENGSIALTIVLGLLTVLFGVIYGVVIGAALWFLPAKDSEGLNTWRLLLLLGFGQLALLGSWTFGPAGAGVVGCLVLAYTASIGWRRELKESKSPRSEIPAETTVRRLWHQWRPFLLGLTASKEINFFCRSPCEWLGLAVMVLIVGLTFRMVASYLAMHGSGLNHKEKLFVSFAWLPKSVIQAALGLVAWDAGCLYRHSSCDWYFRSRFISIIILSVVITAPLGAGVIAFTAPRLLRNRANQQSGAKFTGEAAVLQEQKVEA